MIGAMRKFLESKGFENFTRQGYFRAGGMVSSLVYETSYGVGIRKVRMNVGVEIADPFILQQREYHTVSLAGDVTPQDIIVQYEPKPCWITPEHESQVADLMRIVLEEWFKHWSDVGHLIAYLENPVDTVATKVSVTSHEVVHNLGKPVVPRKVPNVDYLLSLLHYYAGNNKRSKHYCDKWLKFVRQTALQEEPERTMRHLDAIAENRNGRRSRD